MVMATSGHQRNYSQKFVVFFIIFDCYFTCKESANFPHILNYKQGFFLLQKSHLSDVYNKTVHVHVLVKK